MSHPLPSALRPDHPAPGRVMRPAEWAGLPNAGPEVAVLITGCDDIAAAVRGYATVLPRARMFLYGDDLSPASATEAEAAGAVVRRVAPSGRDALVRRMFAEVDTDIYILAHGAGPDDVCVAPLIVAEVDHGKDLVDVARFDAVPPRDPGDRLLARTVDFLFGHGGDGLSSDFKACSRRFVLTYGDRSSEGASALDLTLHALRLRMPVGGVTALGAARLPPVTPPPRGFAGWARLAGLVARLLVEERPRRVLGVLGLTLVAGGVAAALPALRFHHGRATMPLGPETLAALGLMAAGGGVGLAGLLLDALTSARQEVRRLGCLAIPRRAERSGTATRPG